MSITRDLGGFHWFVGAVCVGCSGVLHAAVAVVYLADAGAGGVGGTHF